jgi:hypothetical protein
LGKASRVPDFSKEVLKMGKRLATVAAVGVVAVATPGSASAAPFLCPIVGDGINTADAQNGDNGVQAINPPAGASLLPGKNQAGARANPEAYNEFGGPDAGNSPGTPGFTPIWNP